MTPVISLVSIERATILLGHHGHDVLNVLVHQFLHRVAVLEKFLDNCKDFQSVFKSRIEHVYVHNDINKWHIRSKIDSFILIGRLSTTCHLKYQLTIDNYLHLTKHFGIPCLPKLYGAIESVKILVEDAGVLAQCFPVKVEFVVGSVLQG